MVVRQQHRDGDVLSNGRATPSNPSVESQPWSLHDQVHRFPVNVRYTVSPVNTVPVKIKKSQRLMILKALTGGKPLVRGMSGLESRIRSGSS